MSFTSLAVYRFRVKDFVWPVYKEFELDKSLNGDAKKVLRFSKTQLFMLILGGMCEFLISLSIIMAFNAALKANINQGIGTSLITLNAVIVSILSYVFYGEKISLVNGLGIVVVIVALVIIALFGPENEI